MSARLLRQVLRRRQFRGQKVDWNRATGGPLSRRQVELMARRLDIITRKCGWDRLALLHSATRVRCMVSRQPAVQR
jgi:hypothetical protein